MRSLIDLKKDLSEGKLENLYVFTGEENLIRKIYYEKIGEIYGNLKSLDNVQQFYKESGKRSLFAKKSAYLIYNDLDFLKQKEAVYEKLLALCKKNVVILVYDEIPEKSTFRKFFEDYITVFNKVTDDVAIKYVHKECPKIKDRLFAQKIAFNCYNSYNSIVEEMNKYNNYLETNNNDDAMDVMVYACLFLDRKITPTPKLFANAFITRNIDILKEYLPLVSKENILGYLPELYNTVVLCLYFGIYGKWDGGSKAYNAGEYWGRVKELRDLRIAYSKNDLLDVRYLINKLDVDIRSGKMKAEYAWDYLIGVIL